MVANQISFDLKSNLTSLENILPGIELFSQGATTQLLSPLLRFTSEFEMDRCGSTAPWTPGKLSSQENPENCIGVNNFLSPSGKKDFKTASLRGVWSSPRSISTPPLHALLRFHVEPINGCSSRDLTGLCHGNTHLEVGFPLRCFQRLSTPHMATQRLPLAR